MRGSAAIPLADYGRAFIDVMFLANESYWFELISTYPLRVEKVFNCTAGCTQLGNFNLMLGNITSLMGFFIYE